MKGSRTHYPLAFTILLALLISSCSGSEKNLKGHPIAGKWHSVVPDISTDYELGENGEGLWIFQAIGKMDTIHIHYLLNDSLDPKTIEISGFNKGALQGMVLYGIYQISNDSLSIDFEPGNPDNPRKLKMFRPGETVVFKRRD